MRIDHAELLADAAHSAEIGICSGFEFIRYLNEWGYVLAKIPDRYDQIPGVVQGGHNSGWNACLDNIKIINVEDLK